MLPGRRFAQSQPGARGCDKVPGSIRSGCGTPSSVRTKSSALSEKTSLPILVFTSAGTSTKFERTERSGVCEPEDDCSVLCAQAAANEIHRSNATTEMDFRRCMMRFASLRLQCSKEWHIQ